MRERGKQQQQHKQWQDKFFCLARWHRNPNIKVEKKRKRCLYIIMKVGDRALPAVRNMKRVFE